MAPKLPETNVVAGPVYSRIGPIFDPAWLRLIDIRVLNEIISVQLDAVVEQMDIEKRAIVKIKTIVNKSGR